MALTPRGRALRWLTNHRGITEDPPGSNRDNRKDGITAAQKRLGSWLVGLAWCGVWAANAALQGGVKIAEPWNWASVRRIEIDAQAHRNGFRGAVTGPIRNTGKQWAGVFRADLVTLFGGEHVETIRSCARAYRLLGVIRTEGGNTSSGNAGSQANGGGAFPRWRRISDIHVIAKVNYPDR
jgi:hypothetical protein